MLPSSFHPLSPLSLPLISLPPSHPRHMIPSLRVPCCQPSSSDPALNKQLRSCMLGTRHSFRHFSSLTLSYAVYIPFSRLPGCCTTWLLCYLVVVLPGCCATWLLRYLVVVLPGCCATWLLHYLVVVLPGCCATGLLRYLVVVLPGCCATWLLHYLVVALPGCCSTWLLHYLVVVLPGSATR